MVVLSIFFFHDELDVCTDVIQGCLKPKQIAMLDNDENVINISFPISWSVAAYCNAIIPVKDRLINHTGDR